MDLGLGKKKAVITGGSRGIGLAVAAALLAEGAEVLLVARDAERLDNARSSLQVDGGVVHTFVADTSDDASVAAMASAAAETLGGANILVNAAAIPPPIRGDVPASELTSEMDVKVLGSLRCARALAPWMLEEGWGRIVNVGGLWARQTGSIVGSIRNVAIAAMTKNLADEYGSLGVNVTLVHPGITVTERTPELIAAQASDSGVSEIEIERTWSQSVGIGRLVTAEEVANVIVFLCSPKSVAIQGDAIPVGGGQPGPIFY
jgi:NAD(P)-dependent dehydrogenase (short-subunit alcohol dehydrogenase family)